MQVENAVYPNEQQMAAFGEPGPDGPIYMVNLLKFKAKAEYEDGRETDLSGREAYDLYGHAVAQLIQEFGGAVHFAADVTHLTLGRVEELWDEVAIAMYPNRSAMLNMMMSDKMKDIGEHRAAGLAGQINIESTVSAAFQPAD